MPLAHTVEDAPALFLEQIVVTLEPVEEIYMEAVVEGIGRIRPLCYHESTWVFLFKQLSDLTPEELGLVLVGIEELFVASYVAGLHQCSCHISTETVGTHIHPETEHVLQVLTHRQHIRMVGGQLPLLVRIGIGESEVQCGLTPEEVTHELTVALSIAFHKLTCELEGGIHPVGFRPDVIV